MKASNRDLLVLVRDEYLNDREMEQELEKLNDLLYHYETIESFCLAHEVFDMNRHRIIHKMGPMQRIIRQKDLKAFQFISNKN